jgi:cytochrome c peroxidase
MRFALIALVAVAILPGACVGLKTPTLTAQEMETIKSLSLAELPPLPASPSNRFADDVSAAALGRELFFDTRFSANGKVACATCHLPDRQFQDDIPVGRGVGVAARRTMPIVSVSYAPFLFWDGRKDSLWSQALGPLENPAEHGIDRAQVVRLVAEHYRASYERVFGPLADKRDNVEAAFANVGKAIEAYERTLRPDKTRFDAWVESSGFPQPGILSVDEIEGLRLFVGKANCATCHNGPLLTDNYFHNTGVPRVAAHAADDGRASGVALVRNDEFNCLGRFSDARPEECAELRYLSASPEMVGAFKTPSLRGAIDRAPFMDAGQFATLDQVLAHYAAAPQAAVGKTELKRVGLSKQDLQHIAAFLRTLSVEKRKTKGGGHA